MTTSDGVDAVPSTTGAAPGGAAQPDGPAGLLPGPAPAHADAAVLEAEHALARARLVVRALQADLEAAAADERACLLRLDRARARAAEPASPAPPSPRTAPPDDAPPAPVRPLRASDQVVPARTSPPTPAPGGAPVPEDAPVPRPFPAAAVLLGVGAVLLLSAAAVFVALTWSGLGVGGRAAVLAAATGVSAGLTVLLRRAGLRAGTEAFASVTAGLLVLDLVGLRVAGPTALQAVDGAVWTAVSALVVLLVAGGAARAGAGDRRVVTAVVVASGAVPVLAVAGVVVVASQVARRAVSPAGDLLATVVVGPLDALLLVGLPVSVLARTVRPPPGLTAPARTAAVVGWVLLAATTLLALLAAAALWPWWTGAAGATDAAPVAVRVAVAGAAVVGLAPWLLVDGWPRTVASAAGWTVVLAVAVSALHHAVQLPWQLALVLPLLGATLLTRSAVARRCAPGAAVPVAGVAVLAGVVLLAVAVVVLAALAPDAAAGEVADPAQWREGAVLVLTTTALALLPLGVGAGWPHPSGGTAGAAVRRLLAPVALAVAGSTLAWSAVLLLPLPTRAVVALLTTALVPGVLALGLRRRRSGRGLPLGRAGAAVLVATGAAHGTAAVLLAAATDVAAGGQGRLLAAQQLLLGVGLLAVALAAGRTPPWRTPPPETAPLVGTSPLVGTAPLVPPVRADVGPARRGDVRNRAEVAASAAVAAAVTAFATGCGLLAAAAPVLHSPAADGAVVALVVTALAASALLLLPGWSRGRPLLAGLGVVATAVALVSLGRPAAVATTWPGVGLERDTLAGLAVSLAVAVHAVALTTRSHGRATLRRPGLRHAVLPGPLVTAAVAALAAARPLLERSPLDVTALSATAVLLVLAGYAAAATRRSRRDALPADVPPDRPPDVPPPGVPPPAGTAAAVVRRVLVPALLALAATTVLVACLPLLAGLPLVAGAVPWVGVLGTVVVASRGVTSTTALPARLRAVAGAVLRPLAERSALLVLLVAVRPLTGLPVELEGLLVAAVALLQHLLGTVGRHARGEVGAAVTLRDATAVGTALVLGVVGVLAAASGDRPLWVAGCTWLLTAAWALSLAVVVPGRLAGPRPPGGQDRGWWALRVGAAAGLLGLAAALTDAPGPLDRFTLPAGAVLLAFGWWALRVPAADGTPPGTVRCLGPGLALLLAPSTLPAVWDPVGSRPLLVAGAGVLLLVAGAVARWRAPLVAGALVVVPVALVQALPVVSSLPQWVWLAAAGALALAVGVSFERQRQRALAAGRRWRELR